MAKQHRAYEIISSPIRIFKFLCFWTGFTTLVISFGLTLACWRLFHSLPDFHQWDFQRLKDVGMKAVERKFENQSQSRSYRWASMPEISRDFLYTVVMSEDAGFFEHDGIDFDALMNSLAENIRKRKYEYGGSTISQQVVKNLFLTHEKSLVRKLKEFLITERLERRFTKNQILEVYLNIAEFGPDLFGVNEASARYFKKKPSQINAAEGAFIALMLPSPRRNYYSIFQNRNLTSLKRHKMRRVLGDMLASEFISQSQYQQYIKYNYFNKK